MRAAIVACNVAGTSTSVTSADREKRTGSPRHHAALNQIARDLLGEKRVTCGTFGDQILNRGKRPIRPQEFIKHHRGFGLRERGEGNCLRTVDPRERSVVLGTVGDHGYRRVWPITESTSSIIDSLASSIQCASSMT